MEPILIALFSAVMFGFNILMIKMGMHRKPYALNSIITFSTAALVMWIIVLLADNTMPSAKALPFFVIAGMLAPGLSAILTFESFKKAGISITSSLIATAPFFSTILAIIFLGEEINAKIGMGTLLIVSGVIALSWFRPKSHIKLTDLLFPVIAALIIGTASVISKFGLNISNVPFSGIAIAATAGAITQLIFITARKKWGTIANNFHDMKYFLIAGVFVGFALASLFLAISKGNLVVVFPIANTQTLFAILFSWLFFREHDHITRHTLIGAVTIVLGATLVSLGA